MNFIYNYNETIVKYDLINKFNYKHLQKIPELKSLTLTFKLKKYDIKTLISALAAIEILTSQKAILNYSKVSNVSLKIRKGQPIGCKVTLRKKNFRQFFNVLLNTTSIIKNKINYKSQNSFFFSLTIENILVFSELEKNYQFFKKLSNLNINLTTTNCKNKELVFLLKSNKLVI